MIGILSLVTGALAAPEIDVDGGVRGGVLSGLGTLRVTEPFVHAKTRVRPSWEWGAVDVRVPVTVEARKTLGGSLDDYRATVGTRVRWRPEGVVRAQGKATVGARWRPGWPDQYQPTAQGGLLPTDRYSHWVGNVEAKLSVVPSSVHRVDVAYRVRRLEYRLDPNFHPVALPMHIPPHSHVEQRATVTWEVEKGPVEAALQLRGWERRYSHLYARDKATGQTHAGPGGRTANPLQRWLRLEPTARVRVGGRKDRVQAQLAYTLELQSDTYQGYYSFVGHRPELDLTVRPADGLEVDLEVQGSVRQYGPNSYQPVGGRPALTSGSRRWDRRAGAELGIQGALSESLALRADVAGDLRRTNFPNYEADVFPRTWGFDIDWNYVNVVASAGIELSL